jgi:hypothetical protein
MSDESSMAAYNARALADACEEIRSLKEYQIRWVEGYEAGKAEQAERDVSRRWCDVIFAFLVGAICGFVAAAILTWTAN